MRSRAIGDLREDAKVVLEHADLEQVYAVNTSLQVHDRNQVPPLTVESDLRVRGEQIGDRVEAWARYETTARRDPSDGTDADEAIEGGVVVDVWTVRIECVAVFKLDDPDLSLTDDQVEAFALLVGMPTVHPYAREWTQTLTGHSQYPAFTMGLIDSPAEGDPEDVLEFPDDEQRS